MVEVPPSVTLRITQRWECRLGAVSDVVTYIKDLSRGVTYEIVLRSGSRFRGQLAQSWDWDVSAGGQFVRFELFSRSKFSDKSERSVHAFEFASATPFTPGNPSSRAG